MDQLVQIRAFWIADMAICVFFAVLFLQSGFDKVTDRKGNLEWLTGHFAHSPFRRVVPLLLSTLTVAEIAAGLAAVVALVMDIFGFRGYSTVAFAMASAVLLMLFLGQRIAKDYPGAAVLASYFGVAILGLITSSFRMD